MWQKKLCREFLCLRRQCQRALVQNKVRATGVVWFSRVEIHRKKSGMEGSTSTFERVSLREKRGFEGYPPPPPPRKAAPGAGFTKMPRKILNRKGLEVKILTTKNLQTFSGTLPLPLTP